MGTLTIRRLPAHGADREQHVISDAVGWVAARLYGRTDEEAEQVLAFLSGEAPRVEVALPIEWRPVTESDPPKGKLGPYLMTDGEGRVCIAAGVRSNGMFANQYPSNISIPFTPARYVPLSSVLSMIGAAHWDACARELDAAGDRGANPPHPEAKWDPPTIPDGTDEAAMVVIERDSSGKPTVWCDPEIVDIVSALNTSSLRTVASCSGHGDPFGFVSLADGRELLILPSYDSTRFAERALLKAFKGRRPEAKAGADDIFSAYETWPEDIRAKLSLHDLRRMGGWAPRPNPDGWAIDTSTGRPILVLNGCSVIEAEDARYVLGLIRADQKPKPAEGGAVANAGRTDRQIVDQTEDLAAIFMLEIYSRESATGATRYRDQTDPRGKHCWQLACRVQEMLTATDPENSVEEVDDTPEMPAAATRADVANIDAIEHAVKMLEDVHGDRVTAGSLRSVARRLAGKEYPHA